jgi:hypothetical protein
MKTNLALIGYGPHLKSLVLGIKLAHQRDIDWYEDAKTGLEATTREEYPLIFLNDVIAAGNSVLPEQIGLEDGLEMGCYLIGEIRKGINKKTPILVMHMFPPHKEKTAVRRYMDAGATECINTFLLESSGDFEKIVGKYL